MSAYPPSPATFIEFAKQFPTEDACETYLARWRWPQGFRCPACGSARATRLSTRPVWECRECGRQTSVTAGTAMQHSKVPLRIWLYALWLLGRRKKGTSAIQFQRETGLGSYSTALYLLHKVRQLLAEEDMPRLEGPVELDDSIMPGKSMKPGKHLGKGGVFIFAAVERRQYVASDGTRYQASGSARAVLSSRCDSDAALGFAESSIKEGALIVTDGGAEFASMVEGAFDHDSHDQLGQAKVSERHLRRVHLFFSNLKTWLRGTFHGVSLKHLARYLDEYVYRFNRRFVDPRTFGFLARRLMHGSWTSKRELAAEAGA